MTAVSRDLEAEHRAFEQAIGDLRRLADDCGDERPGPVVDELDASLHFLEHELLPHAAVEDAVLYPAIACLLGSPIPTAMMARDHDEIRRLVTDLRRHRGELGTAVHPAAVGEVRAVLYALHAVISLHLAKEEELLLPVLEAELRDDESEHLLHRMHAHALRTPSPPLVV